MRRPHWFGYLAVVISSLCTSAAFADWSYDFATPPPASFLSLGFTHTSVSPTFSSTVADGVLRLSDTKGFDDGGSVLVIGIETSQVFTDVRMAAILNPTGTTDNLLNLASRNTDATGTAYTAGFNFSTGRIVVAKLVGGPSAQTIYSTDPGQGAQPALTNLAKSYYLQMDTVGPVVTARLFDAPGGTELLHVNYTDTGVGGPVLTSGTSGVNAYGFDVLPTVRVDGTFDNLSATALPEPGGLTLLVIAGFLAARRRTWT